MRTEAVSRKFPVKCDADGDRICSYCGGPLPPNRHKYCSNDCWRTANIEANPHQRHVTIPALDRRCAICGWELTPTGPRGGCMWHRSCAEIHHILPVSEGGENTLDNLIALCHDCHVAIHAVRRTMRWWAENSESVFGEWDARPVAHTRQGDLFI